jgi:uncharacterized protein (TIGR04255 family)
LPEAERDFTFANPPLVELIAEVRWPLQPLTAIPGAIDPHFERFRTAFEHIAIEQGFGFREALPAANVPRELIPHTPIHRLRIAEGEWPLLQFGPGILTVNQVPPYDGWRSFKPVLEQAFVRFLQTYPLAHELVQHVQLQLRYIDAFRETHGVKSPEVFIRDGLNIGLKVPAALLSGLVDPNGLGGTCSVELLLTENLGKGHIQLVPGSFDGKPALIANFIVQSQDFSVLATAEEVSAWFDRAHNKVRELFFVTVPAAVLATFGARKPLD